MTPGAARAIDPILTAVARGYRSAMSPVANVLFPGVPVMQRGGRIVVYGPESFRLVDTRRAPGANTKRIQWDYSTNGYALVDHSLEALVPVEIQQEAAAVPGLDVAAASVRTVQDRMAREREKQAADLALNAALYGAANKVTLTGADQWSDPTSDVFGDVQAAREAVRSKVGVRPNVMVVGPKVLNALSNHPLILARLRGGAGSDSTDRGPASLVELARVFDIAQVVEGDATHWDGAAFQDIWGKFAVLAYTVPASMADLGSPSFGYTYQLEGYPSVETGYYDNNPKSWVYPVTDARQPQLVGPDAGFLISGAVA
jgi:hypothetical protein